MANGQNNTPQGQSAQQPAARQPIFRSFRYNGRHVLLRRLSAQPKNRVFSLQSQKTAQWEAV